MHGSRFNVECTAGPSVLQLLRLAGVVTLGHVVQLCGPDLNNAAALVSHLGVRSVRFITHLLNTWRCELTQTELSLLTAHCNGHRQPNNDDPFPALTIAPDFKNCTGRLLESSNTPPNRLNDMKGKTMYKLLVQVLNKDKLSGRTDTPWRAHLGLNDDVRPAWRTLYKPPITKRVGDLQWRILHGIVAVNAFISVINPNVNKKCSFCPQRETVFHCFMDCGRLDSLFQLLQRMFTVLGNTFSREMFILGCPYLTKRLKCQLIHFILGQSKIAFYLSRRNELENSLDVDAATLFVRMVKARLHIDFSFYRTANNVEEFSNIWSLNNVLRSVIEHRLIFGLVLS